jgi:hypothetical protein
MPPLTPRDFLKAASYLSRIPASRYKEDSTRMPGIEILDRDMPADALRMLKGYESMTERRFSERRYNSISYGRIIILLVYQKYTNPVFLDSVFNH